MKLQVPPMVTLQAAAVVATATIGAAGTVLCAACGGAEDPTMEPTGQVVVLDIDQLGSTDAAEREALASRGAPGDAEPVLYLVRAVQRQAADVAAAELIRRGFETVRTAAQRHEVPQRVAR